MTHINKFKIGDYVVVHSEYEMRFAKGSIIALNKTQISIKDNDGQISKFDLNDDIDIVRAEKPNNNFKTKTVYVLHRNDEYEDTFSTLKKCYDWIKRNYYLSYENSFKDYLNQFSVRTEFKFCRI